MVFEEKRPALVPEPEKGERRLIASPQPEPHLVNVLPIDFERVKGMRKMEKKDFTQWKRYISAHNPSLNAGLMRTPLRQSSTRSTHF